MHIDSEELSGYLAYLQGRQKGVTLEKARRWMEIQAHVKSCQSCQRRLQAVAEVERLEAQVIERFAPKSKWDALVTRMKDSASVFEIRMKDMFESAEIRLREAGRGNQWQPVAVRGETSEWEGSLQEEAFLLGAAAGGIYLEGADSVQVHVFERREDGMAGDPIYQGSPRGLEDLDFEAGDYLVVVDKAKTLDESVDQ